MPGELEPDQLPVEFVELCETALEQIVCRRNFGGSIRVAGNCLQSGR
jgi:hypothetical protein